MVGKATEMAQSMSAGGVALGGRYRDGQQGNRRDGTRSRARW